MIPAPTLGRTHALETAARPHSFTPAAIANELPAPDLDPRTMLLGLQRLLCNMHDNSVATGQARIAKADELRKKHIEEEQEARKREAEAERKDGGFFDGLKTAVEALTVDLAKFETITDPFETVKAQLEKAGNATIDSRQFWAELESGALEVAKWAAVAGSTALAVASLGAATPIAALAVVGAVMSCAAAADSSFHIMEKLGVDKDTAAWVNVGLIVGGALCSGGAGAAQMLSGGANTVSTAVRAGAVAANIAGGGASVAAGVAHVELAAFDRDAKLAAADVYAAQQSQQRMEHRIQATIDAIKDVLQSKDRAMTRVQDAMTTQNATAIHMVRA